MVRESLRMLHSILSIKLLQCIIGGLKSSARCTHFMVVWIVACQTVQHNPCGIVGKSHGTLSDIDRHLCYRTVHIVNIVLDFHVYSSADCLLLDVEEVNAVRMSKAKI